MIVVHVTPEAVGKIGGIGAVVDGLSTADAYADRVSRTILLGPLFSTDGPVNLRLGPTGRVRYSSLDEIEGPPWREKFRPIEKTYDVGIIYGTRWLTDACTGKQVEAEVLLIDVFHANKDRLNLFKGELFDKFDVPSAQFESTWEYEQYVRLAEPGYEALRAIGCDGDGEQVVILAHEYMGMPTALKAVMAGEPNYRTVFYAHEVASVRPIVEKTEGHDTMFYNVLDAAAESGRYIEDVFPQVSDSYKHPLVKAARYCDCVFAVGDFVAKELKFLDRHFSTMEVDLVYNGIPAMAISLEEKQLSRRRMIQYASNLFGWAPTWTFTHVARPVLSKGIWRDLRVLDAMEPLLAERGESAVFFMLGTLAGQRRPQDIRQMEKVYGWPVVHEVGYPDLCHGEQVVGETFEAFNQNHEAVKVVLVNQWDWGRKFCGARMPEEMTFTDNRRGTDVEFGLSVYEPFGISQFEPLCFGSVCVVSNVCGCMGYARKAAENGGLDGNIIEADFLSLPEKMTIDEMLKLSIADRDRIENVEARQMAAEVIEYLPRGEGALAERMESGLRLARQMSWERVVEDYFLPSLERAASTPNGQVVFTAGK